MSNKNTNNDISAFAAGFLSTNLAGRYQEVIKARYGLHGGEPETLQAIGDRYGITRERVRQIEAIALDNLRNRADQPYIKSFVQSAMSQLKVVGGAQKEDQFLAGLHKAVADRGAVKNFVNPAKFLLELAGKFSFHNDNYDPDWHRHWYTAEADKKKAYAFVSKLVSALRSKKEMVLAGKKFDEVFAAQAKTAGIADSVAKNYLAISKNFTVGPFNEFGLADWSEINPKTARDWAYAILKKEKRPLHFRELYEAISASRKEKRTNLQTVHNELIKDARFVLVGRGLYGLKEFGLIPGTAKEIIAHVLKNKGPLPHKEVVKLVMQQRMIKEGTIMINLQNQKYFKSLPDGRYTVREV